MKRMDTRGFSPVEIIITLLVVALLAGGGFLVWKRQNAAQNNTAASSTSAGAVDDTDVPTSPEITTTNDLDTSVKALDEADLNSSDSSALDTQTDGF